MIDKKILDVPMVRQPLGSLECGIACAKMILDYDQKDISYDQVKEDLPIRPDFGLYLYEIGSYFITHGYQAEISGFNTHFMNGTSIGASTEKLYQQAKAMRELRCGKEPWKHLIPGYETLDQFIENGGQLSAKIMNTKELKAQIDQGRPVLVALTNATLYKSNPWHNEHFSVISGYAGSKFELVNPGSSAKGKKKQFPATRIIHAIHANTAPSVEGGMVLKLIPPSP